MNARNATVGETRAWLEAAYGVPHTLSTHYVIVADSPDGFRVVGCCDGTDEGGTMLSLALAAMRGEAVPAPASGSVIVSRDDLRAVLSANPCANSEALARLAEAAGVTP